MCARAGDYLLSDIKRSALPLRRRPDCTAGFTAQFATFLLILPVLLSIVFLQFAYFYSEIFLDYTNLGMYNSWDYIE